jgi:hypothetical protein
MEKALKRIISYTEILFYYPSFLLILIVFAFNSFLLFSTPALSIFLVENMGVSQKASGYFFGISFLIFWIFNKIF